MITLTNIAIWAAWCRNHFQLVLHVLVASHFKGFLQFNWTLVSHHKVSQFKLFFFFCFPKLCYFKLFPLISGSVISVIYRMWLTIVQYCVVYSVKSVCVSWLIQCTMALYFQLVAIGKSESGAFWQFLSDGSCPIRPELISVSVASSN